MTELPPPVAGAHQTDTAICCSGGGIRSATYCLGAMQALAAGGAMRRADVVTAVSGGSYIAAAWALQAQAEPDQHDRASYRDGYQKAFKPGSAEESRLRDHTHYLVPNAVQGVHGVLSLIWGAVGNLLLVTSISYVLLGLDGWLLRAVGGVRWVQQDHGFAPRLSIVPLQVWIPAGLVIAAVAGFAASRLPLAQRGPRRSVRTRGDLLVFWTTMLLCLAAAAALLLIGGPALFAASSNVHWVTTSMNQTPSVGDTAATLSLYAIGLATIAKGAAGTVSAYWSRLGKGGEGVVRPWLARAGRVVMPWLGSALIVAGLAAWGVYILGISTRPGYPYWHLAIGAAIFLVLHVTLDVNRTSMHDYYRDRLASSYTDPARSATRLSQLHHATPALTVCAAANLSSGSVRSARLGSQAGGRLQRGVPPARGAVSWVFTPSETGLHFPNLTGGDEMVATSAYEALLGTDRMSLFDIVADSGAAFSPLAGKATAAAHRLLLAACNVRLGVWLPRPALVGLVHQRVQAAERAAGRRAWAAELAAQDLGGPLTRWWLSCQLAAWEKVYREHGTRTGAAAAALRWRIWQPNLLLLWREATGRSPVGCKWIYVTDGGHYDNLGLVEALRSNPRRIYLIDATGDPDHSYRTLGHAIALARADLGIEIRINPLTMDQPASAPPAAANGAAAGDGEPAAALLRRPALRQAYAVGDFRYTSGPRAGQRGTISMIKLGVWAGENMPWDVLAYYAAQPTFPRSSALQQLYDDQDFEAYRELGAASIRALLASPEHQAAGRRQREPRVPEPAPHA